MQLDRLVAAIRPRNDNVLIRIRKPVEQTLPSGLVMPATVNTPNAIQAPIADVLAVGPGHYGKGKMPGMVGDFVPIQVKPGDAVLLDGPNCGDYVDEKRDPYLRMVREEQIHGVLEEASS